MFSLIPVRLFDLHEFWIAMFAALHCKFRDKNVNFLENGSSV